MSSLYDSNKHKKLIITKTAGADSDFYPDDSDKYKPSKYFLDNLYSSKDATSFDISVPFAVTRYNNYANKFVYSANVNVSNWGGGISDSGPHWINRNSLYDFMSTYGLYSGVYTPELDGLNWEYMNNDVSTYTETQGTGGGASYSIFNFPIPISQANKTQFKLYKPLKVTNTDVIITADAGTDNTDICVSANHSFSFRLGYEGIISGKLDDYFQHLNEKPPWQRWCIVSIKGGYTTAHACTDLNSRTFKYITLDDELNNLAKTNNYTNLCRTEIRKLRTNVYYISDMNFNTYSVTNNRTYIAQPTFASGGPATFCNNGQPRGFSIYYVDSNKYYCYTGSSATYQNKWYQDSEKDYIVTKYYFSGTNSYLTASNPTQTNGWSNDTTNIYKLNYDDAVAIVNNLNANMPTGADYRFNCTYQPSKRTFFKTSTDAEAITAQYHAQVPTGQSHLTLNINPEYSAPSTLLAKNVNIMPIPEIRWLALNYYIKIL